MISFSSQNIFKETPVNAFLEEKTIPDPGTYSFKYFLKNLEVRFFNPFPLTKLDFSSISAQNSVTGFWGQTLLRKLGITAFFAF